MNNLSFISNLEIDGIIKINNKKKTITVLITPWTYSHFLFGCLFGYLDIKYIIGFILHSFYEGYNLLSSDQIKKWGEIFIYFYGDTFANTIMDTIFFLLGMFLMKNFYNKFLFFFILIFGIIFNSNWIQNKIIDDRLKWLDEIYKNTKIVKQKKKKESFNIFKSNNFWIFFTILFIILNIFHIKPIKIPFLTS